MPLKKDKYFRARGSMARMLDIHCANCQAFVLNYQKDGKGNLLRCYLNRIFAPPELERLQNDPAIMEPSDLSNLECSNCKSVIGTPFRYMDDRLAFRLRKGTYFKRNA